MNAEKSQPASDASTSSSIVLENKGKLIAGQAECVKGRQSLFVGSPLGAVGEGIDTGGSKTRRQRRMSTGMVDKFPDILGYPESPKATIQDETSEKEDWLEFATSGKYDGPEAVADESESLKLLAALEPYVPRLLVHSVLYEPETQLGKTPTIETFFGAVMIADISGFTTLTERALTSKRGTELVEELLVAMNNYFSQAGDIVLMFGGDIIKYAGDAMIICFPRSAAVEETEKALALRAASCAFELMTSLGVYTPQVKLGGYGDTLIVNDGNNDDIKKMPRKLSRSTSPDIQEDNEIESHLSVLVVDDYLINRVVLRQMLIKLNCEVMEVGSGKEAVAASSREEFDAIFMDVHMPGMDGCSATQLIRQSSKPNTPVIGVCTKYDDDLKGRCLNAGMNQLLVKPLVMSQLVAVLRGLKLAHNQEAAVDSSPTETTVVPGGGLKGVYTEHAKANEPSKDVKPTDPVKDTKRRGSERRGSEQIRQPATNLRQPTTQTSKVATPDAPVVLTMKVLVGMGQIAMLSVGGGSQLPSGKPRWEYFMVDVPVPRVTKGYSTRKPLEQLRLCEEVATPGSVILSPETWALCQTCCEGKLLADGFVQLVHVKTHSFIRPAAEAPYDVRRVPVANNIIKRYLPEMLTSKLEAASAKDSRAAGVRPEVRHVTSLFLGFPGLSSIICSDSELLSKVQKIMITVQRSLRVFDGLLVQFKVDEKGYVMICAFGLPGNLHEDDPKRGIQTALDIQKSTATLGQTTDIGVTTGTLLCTVIGSKKRREYTVFGNCINLSARLMKKAKNEILIDMDTYKLAGGEFDVEALPPMEIKGRTGLIDVYRVVRSKTTAVGVKSVRRLSTELACRSAMRRSEEDVKTELCGRKMEMELAMSNIGAFVARYSEINSLKLKETNTDVSNQSQVQTVEAANSDVIFPSNNPDETTHYLPEVNPLDMKDSPVAKEVSCTSIVIIGQAGIGKTRLLHAIGSNLTRLHLEVIGVSNMNNNMLVYGVWVKLLLDLLPFDPISSPEERGLIVLKYLHPDLHGKAYLLKDVLKVQFKESSSVKGIPTGRRRSQNLRRTASEVGDMRKESEMRLSFIAGLAAKGALLVGGRKSHTQQLDREQLDSEPGSQTSASLDSGFGSEADPTHDSDAEEKRTEMTSTLESSNSTSRQLLTTVADTEDILSVDSTIQTKTLRRNSSETLSLLTSTNSSPKTQDEETNRTGFSRGRRRSSTEEHLSKSSSPEVKIQWLGHLLLDLLLAAASKPLVILLEDGHLMDNPSWSLLRGLSEEKDSGILVVAACRPWGAHAPKEYTLLIEAESTLQLHLKELDEESTEALVRQKVFSALNADINIPPTVFRAISRRTRGHPLFAEQMTMALVELTLKSAHSQEGKANILQTLNLDTYNFSHSMEALIASRVDLLEPNQALALKVASVIGLNFSVDGLLPILSQQLQREEIACPTKQQLDLILQGLERLNFIVHNPVDPGVYSFANSVSRDSIYEMLPMKQRRTIHADVAQELLKLGTSGVRCVNIAEHYTMACKDVEEMEIDLTVIAIDHWQEAASSAMFKLGQYKLAVEYYQNAISLGRIVHDHMDPQRIARWHFYMGKAYGALGDMDSSLQNAIMALDYLGEKTSDFTIQQQTSVGCTPSLIATLSLSRAQCQSGILSWLAAVTGRVGNEQVLFFRCEALAFLSGILISREDAPAARKVTKRYMTVASDASRLRPLELARAYAQSAVSAKSASSAKHKYHKCLEILRIQRRSRRPAVQAGDIHFCLAKLYQNQGKWVKAEKHVLEAQRIYEESQGRRELDICRCLIGLGHLYQGRVESALAMGTRVLEYQHDHPQLRFWSTYLVVSCLDALKRYKESAEVLAPLKDQASPLYALSLQMKALGWVSAMHLGDNRATAQEVVTCVPRLLDLVPMTPAFPLAYASAAEALLISLEIDEVPDDDRRVKEKLLEHLVKFLKTASTRIGICYTYYKFYQARLTLMRGKNQLAISMFEEAMKNALKLRMVGHATTAGDWFETCSKHPGSSPGFVYSRLKTSYTEPFVQSEQTQLDI